MLQKSLKIYEKTAIIPIPKKINKPFEVTHQYSLKEHNFYPISSSPPNDFMLKLLMRITNYKNHESLDNE